jgi:hypothetical protein
MFASESRYFALSGDCALYCPNHSLSTARPRDPDRMSEIIRTETDYSSPVAEAVIEHCITSERVESFSTKSTYSWLKEY